MDASSSARRQQYSPDDEEIIRQPEPAGIVEEDAPFSLQPLGAALSRPSWHVERIQSLGTFALLPDELLTDVLQYLEPSDLAKMAGVSKYMRAFASQDEIWQNHCEKLFQHRPFSFTTSWKTTFFAAQKESPPSTSDVAGSEQSTSPEASPKQRTPQQDKAPRAAEHQETETETKPKEQLDEGNNTEAVIPVYSDFLYNSWYYAAVCIDEQWLENETMERVVLSASDFYSHFQQRSKPVILKGLAKDWPAFSTWPNRKISEITGGTAFKAGPFNVTLEALFKYSQQQHDQRPLYIFDKDFVKRCPQLGEDYKVPEHFQEDLFSVLGDKRPHYRWLIAGPTKSGSTWHKDPNSTSAWNALLEGEKRWIMTPPDCTPPGVYPSPDGSAVATPISVAEWFVSYYDALKESGIPFVEGTQRPGDVVFVPHGWWHVVLNLKPSIAVTQNYVDSTNLHDVLHFLATTPDQISGVPEGTDLYGLFVDALRVQRPHLLPIIEEEAASRSGSSTDSFHTHARKRAKTTDSVSTFSFNFS
eukprot:m.193555 g.193555  ORF g.193555 m.193555 type:complete len:530 (-) comp16783_c0_seq4:266-1855(-)